MRVIVAFGLGLIAGVSLMGFFCDWMLVEVLSVLRRAEASQDDAVRLVGEHSLGES